MSQMSTQSAILLCCFPRPHTPRQEKLEKLQEFLMQHGFEHVNAPVKFDSKSRFRTCFSGTCKEELYPLHVAVKAGNPELVSLLLREGAEIDQESCTGLTPLKMARQLKCNDSRTQIVRILKGNQTLFNKTWSAKDLLYQGFKE